MDAAAAACGLLAASPLLLAVGLAVRLTSPGPVLFRQVRVGRGGRPFTMLKFRTMVAAHSGPQITMPGDQRVTSVGRFLRATKLDELPELWNVLVGDMALVGPRPEVPALVDTASSVWREVLAARPGVTDPVTLRLRDEEALLAASGLEPERFYREKLLPWKLAGYASYQRRRSAWSDLGVLVATLLAVLRVKLAEPPTVAEVVGEARSR